MYDNLILGIHTMSILFLVLKPGVTINHEMNIQEANNIKNLYKGISTSKK
jgi:hypothetical protein